MGYGSSCKFPTKTGAVQWPITRSFSMDCFVGGLGRKPQRRRPRSLLLATRGRPARASAVAATVAATSLTTVSRDSGRTHLRKEKGRSLTEATAFVPNVTECYIQVTLCCFSGILRSGKVLMVFFGYGDLSML